MKTPIERITEYINDQDTESRNPTSMLKELRARIVQDNSIPLATEVVVKLADIVEMIESEKKEKSKKHIQLKEEMIMEMWSEWETYYDGRIEILRRIKSKFAA